MSWDVIEQWQPSADHITTLMGAGELGGIPELIYKPVRFEKYLWDEYNLQGTIKPEIVDIDSYDVKYANNNLEFNDHEQYRKYSGKGIFCALYNLGKYLNDVSIEIGDPVEHIAKFCTEYMHPYFTDELYDLLSEDNTGSNEMLEKFAAFSVERFMYDLGRFYNAASLHFALQSARTGDMKAASRLAKEGRFFEGLPFFERFKHEIPQAEWGTIDTYISEEDIISEMLEDTTEEYERPRGKRKDMLERLADVMPDFCLRVKLDPSTNRMVFAAEVSSVFDIAWFTLARIITSNGTRYYQGKNVEGLPKELAVVTCPNCGEAFARRSNRQQFCKKEECRKAHNALRQKKYRDNKKLNEI